MRNLGLTTRLIVSFALMLFILVAMVLFNLSQLKTLSEKMNHLSEMEVTKLQWVSKMSDSVRFRGISIRDVVIKQDIAFMKDEVNIMKQARSQYEAAHSALSQLVTGQQTEMAIMQNLTKMEADLSLIYEEVLEMTLNEDFEAAVETISEKLRPAQTDLLAEIAKMSDRVSESVAQSAVSAKASYQNAVTTSLVLLALAMVIGIVLALLITRSVSKPLKEIQQVIHRLETDGDFSQRIHDSHQDETGQTAQSLNGLLDQLQNSFTQINNTLDAVAQGRFDQRVKLDLQGDLHHLQQGVNASVQSVSLTMTALEQIMQALYAGNFSVRMSSEVQGEFKTQVDSAIVSIHDVIVSINKVMEGMAQGNFKDRLPETARGELGQLVRHINASLEIIETSISKSLQLANFLAIGDLTHQMEGNFQGNLLELKQGLNTATSQLHTTLLDILSQSDQVSLASEQMAQAKEDLNQRTQEQASSIERTAAAMTQMAQALEGSKAQTQATEALAQDARREAENGSLIMKQAVKAMGEIHQASSKIAEITTLIDSIAFQTNLLALNAAVEAARAGEHGRGFAVVAGEVRNLAGKSSEAAKTIRQLIDDARHQIDQGTQMVEESDSALQKIQSTINAMGDRISEIANATQEQSLGVSAVHQDINQIDKVTHQNAHLVSELSATTDQLLQQSMHLKERIGEFTLNHHQSQRTLPSGKTLMHKG